MSDLTIHTGAVALAASVEGEGPPIALLHGLTATRRYVVHGSKVLERSGFQTIAYDARGHGASSPAPDEDAYSYEDLAADLVDVLDELGVERAALAGASMGAHTCLRFALDHPDRTAALVLITPAFWPGKDRDLERWDSLSEGLATGGVEGFLAAYGEPKVPPPWHDTVERVLRQRLSAHDHPQAVADALHRVPRAPVFADEAELRALRMPTTIVASRDEADPEHPYAIAERYARAIPGSELISEDPGASPLAWQGGQLSKVIARTAREGFGRSS